MFTFANGFAQDYVSLFITRALQGFGFGGEWAVGSVLMGEVVRSGDRGKAVGTVESGWAIGWGVGRRPNFALFALGSGLVVLVYMTAPITDAVMLALGFPLGFFALGIFSGMGAFLTELYPSCMRGSGQGFAYNFGRGIEALFPTLVGYMSSSLPLGAAIEIFAGGAYVLVLLAVVGLPETKGKVLAV